MPIAIRPEAPGEARIIHELTRAAFRHAPHTSHTEHFIVDALRAAGQLAVSLVAEEHGKLLGHVAVSPVAIEAGDGGHGDWYGLGPISVVPERQREGIGSALMRAALDTLRARGAAGCVLVGDPAYYARFGFAPAAPLIVHGVAPEYVQAIVFAEDKPAGVVRFHEAFEATR
jgi:putative acetyltransferase